MASPKLLNLPEKIDWKDCKMTEDSENRIKDKIRSIFKPFDFTLLDDSDED